MDKEDEEDEEDQELKTVSFEVNQVFVFSHVTKYICGNILFYISTKHYAILK